MGEGVRHKRWLVPAIAGLVLCFPAIAVHAAAAPPVELVDVYHGHVDLAGYWVSEKYDGVRGYWNGQQLLTRSGNVIDVPAWFTSNWPRTAMDGELWLGYGQFSRVSTLVRTGEANDPAWHDVTYHVFDLPEHGGIFDTRVPAIRAAVTAIDSPWVVAIRQFHVHSEQQLQAALQRVLDKGGEGLVLHRGDAPYKAGRGVGLLKVKPYQDAEAKVIGYNQGHGRITGLMGSVRVRTPDGRRFSIGSGFTDAQRADPPPIGSWITYRYNGLTVNGLPRFARFLRARPGGPPPEVGDKAATR